ncbi:MAG: GAF domain-containing protein [Candidatus Rokubacteria bacterium]|nr:GAF domain-containing protein [Candidatus Rokubacteria bacterium]
MTDQDAILLVDDDPEIGRLLGDFLGGEGYEVVVARSCAEGRRRLGARPFGLVLLDLILPDGDGLDFMHEPPRPDAPPEFVIVTGHATLDTAIKAVEGGAAGYVIKPVDFARLHDIVERVFDRRRLRRENTRLHAELRDRLAESEARAAIAAAVGSTLDVREALRRVCRELARLLGADTAAAYLHDRATDQLVPTAAYHVPKEYLATLASAPLPLREQGFRLAVWEERCPVYSDDVAHDARFTHEMFRRFPHQSGLLLPLFLENEVGGGFYVVWWKARRVPSAPELRVLGDVCEQVGLLLRNARLYEREARNRHRLEVLNEISRRLAAVHDTEEVLSLIVSEAGRLLEVEAAGLRLVDGDDLVLAARTESAAAVMSRARIKIGESLSGRVVAEGAPIVVEDMTEDARYDPAHKRGAVALGFRGFLGVPMRAGGPAIGTLNVYTKAARRFEPDEVTLLSAFADQASLAIEKARLFRETEAGRRLLERLYGAVSAMQTSWDRDDRLEAFVRAAHEIVGFDRVRILLVTDGVELELVKAFGEALDPAVDRLPLSPSSGSFYQAVQTRRTVAVLSDADLAAVWPPDPLYRRHPMFRSTRFVVVPLVVGERVIGVVSADNKMSRRPISPSSVEPFTALCQNLAMALEESRLYAETQAREQRATTLYHVTRQLATSLDQDRLLDLIASETIELTGCDASGLYFYDEAKGGLTFHRGLNLDPGVVRDLVLKPGEGVAGRAYQERRAVWTRDRLVDPDLHYSSTARAIVERRALRAYLAVPIVSRDKVLGVLGQYFHAPHDFTMNEIQLVSTLADHAALALENARLYREQQERLARLQTLTRLNQLVSSSLETSEVLGAIARAAAELAGVPLAGFWLADHATRTLTIGALSDPAMGASVPVRTLPFDGTNSGEVVKRRAAVALDDVLADPAFRAREWWMAQGIRSFLGLPVLHQDTVVAVLTLYSAAPLRFTPDDQSVLDNFVAQAAVAITNARLFEETRRREREAKTLSDGLTLLNQASRALHKTLAVDAMLDGALAELARAFGAGGALVNLFAEDGSLLRSVGRWLSGATRPAGPVRRGGISFHVRETRTPLLLRDVTERPDLVDPANLEHGVTSIAAFPIIAQGEPVLGALLLYYTTPQEFPEIEVRLLASYADQLATALENAQLYEETQTQRARLAQIFDSTSDGIVLVSRDGEIQAANRQAGALLGFDAGEVIGLGLAELLAGYRSSVPDYDRVFEALHALLQDPGRGGAGDLELRRAGRVVHWAGQPTKDAAGATMGLTLTLRDVTQERQVAQMKSDFVSFVTHQLRTPLAGIKWMLELGAGSPDVPEDTASYIHDARAAAERLISLVNDLLDVSRLESGKLTFAPQPTDLAALTRSVLDDLVTLVRDKAHELDVAGGEALPPVQADPQLLRQAILNLTSNAIKYTPSGGRIRIRVDRENGWVRWAIQDSGIGISREGQRRLFEKFYRAENVHTVETEGTGLGLYLVRLIVEKHGGRVWCESDKGQGSTFIFTLPVRD